LARVVLVSQSQNRAAIAANRAELLVIFTSGIQSRSPCAMITGRLTVEPNSKGAALLASSRLMTRGNFNVAKLARNGRNSVGATRTGSTLTWIYS
jgi:hypothetical protein